MRNADAIVLGDAAPQRDVHIASFVVQHRDDAVQALSAFIAERGDLELVRSEGSRSIVLCESEDQYALIDRIETLRAVPGVLNVLLIYHHAEPREALDAPLTQTHANGAGS